MKLIIACFITFVFSLASIAEDKPTIVVGSKTFTESYILGEILAQTIEDAGELHVRRRLGLGATGIIFESLKSSEIDIYPEYTGTISEVIIKDNSLKTISQIRAGLAPMKLSITEGLGFNDNYALAMDAKRAADMGISTISDLKKFPDLRVGFTHEFIKRQDGYDALLKFYQLSFKNVKGMEHSLAYESLAAQKLDLIEIYTTDAKISRYKLIVLNDDLNFFPKYRAVFMFRSEWATRYPKTWQAVQKLENSLNEDKMIELNAKVELDSWSFEKTASYFLNKKESAPSTALAGFLKRTQEHLSLVFFSLFLAILVGLPLGILAARSKFLAQGVLLTSGILQTIPSLALLCFLIPVFGIGYLPAVVALFLYALLPIVRNTYVGLSTIDTKLLDSAKALGLTSMQRLRLIDLPLASPTILSGIKLSAVINVGTATLAAFIGAGGYGAMIVTGLALNNNQIILQGAIPSAVLAIMVHFAFEILDKILIPKGLRS